MPSIWQDLLAMQKSKSLSYSMLKGRHSRTLAAVEEEERFSIDSEELIYNLEHVGTVKHNEKGQYFVQSCPLNTLHCRLPLYLINNPYLL